MTDSICGATYDEIATILKAVAGKACRRHNLSTQWAEDIQQELWIVVLRLAKKYDPERAPTSSWGKAKFTTFITLWLSENANRFARIEQKTYGNRNGPLGEPINHGSYDEDDDYGDGVTSHGELTARRITYVDDIEDQLDTQRFLAELDPLLVAHGIGMTDEEIAESLGCPVSQVTTKRRQAFNDLPPLHEVRP